ncbi:hypothetical protein JXB41_00290 [Candidatus Woesearchaeota archaeon]|nr:hypothetical protein [Candidatus Woesearchaeota archaeon]
MKNKIIINEDWIILILFVLGLILRISTVGIFDYPGNLKAADAFNHQLVADNIINTGSYKNMPPYFVYNKADIINVLPPLFYIHVAATGKVTGLQTWNISAIFGMVYNAFQILIIYIFASKIFNSKKIGLIAGSMFVLPFNIDVWIYNSYIGMSIQALGNLLLIFSYYIFYDYVIEEKFWKTIVLTLALTGIYLSHFSELAAFIPLLFIVLIKIIKCKNIIQISRRILIMGLISIIPFVLYIPRVLMWFENRGKNSIKFHIPSEKIPLLFPELSDLSIIILILAITGLIQVLLNWKKYKDFILLEGYFFAYIYIGAMFIVPTYILRHKAILPFFVYPIAAYIIYSLLVKNIANLINLNKTIIVLAVCLIFIAAGIPHYTELKNRLQYQHITKEKFDLLNWLNSITTEDDLIFFFDGFYQGANMFLKRANYILEVERLPEAAQYIAENRELPEIDFCPEGSSFVIRFEKELSLFNYEKQEIGFCPKRFIDFDYIIFEHLNQNIWQLNQFIINDILININNFTKIYEQNNIVILKNEKTKR